MVMVPTGKQSPQATNQTRAERMFHLGIIVLIRRPANPPLPPSINVQWLGRYRGIMANPGARKHPGSFVRNACGILPLTK